MMFFAKFSQTPCWKDLAAHEPKRLDRNDVIVLCDAEKNIHQMITFCALLALVTYTVLEDLLVKPLAPGPRNWEV